MARSGSRDFTLTRNDLIKRAFNITDIYDLRTTIPSEDNDFAVDILNLMLKQWQAANLFLWNRVEATLFTALNTAGYSLGSTGTHATTSYVSTQLNGAVVLGASSLTVDSTTGMTVADNIGIELSDGTRQWTTIATIPDSTTVTTNDTLTAAASDNAYVVAYTDKIYRPLLVLSARTGTLDSNVEIIMEDLRRDDYFDISDKTTAGRPTTYYYDKQLDNGTLYVWPRPDNVDQIINFSFYEEVEDMDSSTDNFDFPQEWTLALMWGLAAELAQAYGMYAELDKIQKKADFLRMQLSEFNYDEESLFILPSVKPYRTIR